MDTAMQELIEWLDTAIEELEGNDSTDFSAGLVAARVKANKALEKEKEQTIKVGLNGYLAGVHQAQRNEIDSEGYEEYLKETYNQNK